jgi:hypothetical protein
MYVVSCVWSVADPRGWRTVFNNFSLGEIKFELVLTTNHKQQTHCLSFMS